MEDFLLFDDNENLNFDVSYKVCYKFVCFKHSFNTIQPEPVGEERGGGRCPRFLTSRPLRLVLGGV